MASQHFIHRAIWLVALSCLLNALVPATANTGEAANVVSVTRLNTNALIQAVACVDKQEQPFNLSAP